jgi:RNA polymerase subunit RPABC4/transcription elongation factor Spt4
MVDIALISAVVLLSVGAACWVYEDAQKRRVPNPGIWAVAAALVLIIGLPLYLLVRRGRKVVSSSKPPYSPISGLAAKLGVHLPAISGLACASCGAILQPDQKFCGSCGAPAPAPAPVPATETPTKFCISCGTKIPSNMNFCGSCGAKQA